MNWKCLDFQLQEIEILCLFEWVVLFGVFGLDLFFKGVSGWIRCWVFCYGEFDQWYWMLLMLVDRVDVVEGIVFDVWKGYLFYGFVECGGRVVW